ncbi:MAG: hypothetical protein KFF68_00400 [Desulfosarcina sp.]|nr:hypothetical protein [Desulfosarcina sp.]
MPEAMPQKDAEQISPQPERRPDRTLSRDLIVSIILVVAAVFAMVVTFTYSYMSHRAESQSAETLKSFSDYLQDSLALSLWNMDEEGIQKICSSFFENTLVEKLRVMDHEGTVIFEKHREDPAPFAAEKTAIVHGETVVGFLEIAPNQKGFRENQRQFMWFSLITPAAVVLVLLVTMGRFTFVSDAIRRYGVTPEELIGQPFLEYVREDDWEIAN